MHSYAWIKKVTVLIVSVAISLIPVNAAFAARKQFNIGTGFVGSSMHSLGTVLAKNLQKNMRLRVTARPFVGPSSFIPLINAGELEMGLTSMAGMGTAYRGIDTDANKDIRVVARLFAMPFAFITRKDSGIKNIADLKGKKVVLDITAAQAVNTMAIAMLEAAGLERKDVVVIPVSGVGQGVEAVVEGNADATPGSVSMSAVRKADATVGVRILNLASPGYEQRLENSSAPGLRSYVIEEGLYPGVETETRIFAMDMYLLVPKALDDEDVVKILDALHASWPEMQKEYGGFKGVSTDEFVHPSQTVPYHKAAIDYYKSGKGTAIWDEQAELRNQKLLDVWK
ncbi:MAG: TAXI family TRAP transporter solute-binding subunit [Emcibacteraceae bacterium]